MDEQSTGRGISAALSACAPAERNTMDEQSTGKTGKGTMIMGGLLLAALGAAAYYLHAHAEEFEEAEASRQRAEDYLKRKIGTGYHDPFGFLIEEEAYYAQRARQRG